MDYVTLKDFAVVGSGFSKGEIITEAALATADIAALVDNGFIKPATRKVKDEE
jgi:hypothetical protein